MSENIKVTFDTAEEDLHVNLDAGAIMYGKMQIGTTTTGESGTEAKVENVGSQTNAILNFTIPKGDKGEQGEKGEKGDTGSPVEVKDIPANTNVDEFFEEGTYAWNGDDGKAITGLPNDIVDMPSFSYMLKITKHSTMTNEKNKFEHYFQEFWLEGMFIYTRKITVRTGLETGRIFYERYSWERKALVNYDGVTVVSTEPTNETEKAKVWLQKNKNLLNFSSFGTKTINGVTFTNNGNGTITINGTASASFGVNFVKFNLGAGTYHLSVNANTSQNFYIYDYDTNTNILSKEATATLTKDYNNIGFDTYINNGQVFDNLIISPQLEVGSSASVFEENATSAIYTKESNNKYEKFTETVGISSTQPINQNGLWIQKGKNLFNYETATYLLAYSSSTVLAIVASSTDTNHQSSYITCKPNTTYTIEKMVGHSFRVSTTTNVPSVGVAINQTIANHTGSTITITTGENDNYIFFTCFSAYDGDTGEYIDMYKTVKIEEGTSITSNKIYTKNDNGVYEEFLNADEVKNDYSLGERRIGTWIDGKPLYRKTIEFPNGNGGSLDYVQYLLSDYGINNVDDIFLAQPSFYTMNNNGRYSFSYNDGNAYEVVVYPNSIQVKLGYAIISNSRFVVTLEYTKTTDVATTSEE